MCETPSELIQKVASDSVIDRAYVWLCKRRRYYSHNDDVWDIRFRWSEFKPHLQKELLREEYTISSQIVIMTPDRRTELWSAKDALVLKAISIVLGEHLKPVLSRNCYHLAGHGGAKAAVRATAKHLKQGQHIMKSDVKSYYASIYHEILFNLLEKCVPDKFVVRPPFFRFFDFSTLDHFRNFSSLCLFYARFMDDWVVCRVRHWLKWVSVGVTI